MTAWYAGSSQSAAFNDHGTPNSNGLYNTWLLSGPEVRQSEALWFYNAAPFGGAGMPIPSYGGLVVDGSYAFTVDAAAVVSIPLPSPVLGVTLPGLGGMAVTPVINSVTGAIGSDQVVPLVRCNDGAAQPAPTAACTAWVRTGIVLHRSFRFSADGTTTWISDRWVSEDGAAHTVKAQSWEAFPTTPNKPAFRFGWVDGATFKTHVTGDVVSPPPTGLWRSDVMGDSGAADGDLRYARGAMIVDRAPSNIVFFRATEWARVYDLAVPAGGEARMRQAYVIASSQAGVDALALAVTDEFAAPSVSITSPANGSTVTSTPATVTGVVTDNVGVTSATLNGVPVTLGAGGVFSTSLVLTGPSTLTLVAKDAAGNSSQAQVSVGFSPVEFTGTDGPDVLIGNALSNVLRGLGGNDRIACGVGGRDQVDAGPGDDTVDCVEPMAVAKAGADTVVCGTGRDTVRVDPFDVLSGCEVVTRVWIGSGVRNVFRGTRANDRFEARGGNDAVTCGGGRDVVLAGAGKDTVNCRDLVPKKANRDLVVCGAGVDSVIVDKFDTVRGCEKVTRR